MIEKMNEIISRGILTSLFIIFIYQSIYSHTFYSIWIIMMFTGSIYEFFTHRRSIYRNLMIILYLYAFFLVCIQVGRRSVLMILTYNYISSEMQFALTKIFGSSLEGYTGSLILTEYLLKFGNKYIFFNLTGMTGRFLSIFVKREYNIKNWGNIFGVHGGFADRIDNIVLPIIACSLLK